MCKVPQRLGRMHKSVVQDRNSAQEFSMDQEGCMGLSERGCKGQRGQAKEDDVGGVRKRCYAGWERHVGVHKGPA